MKRQPSPTCVPQNATGRDVSTLLFVRRLGDIEPFHIVLSLFDGPANPEPDVIGHTERSSGRSLAGLDGVPPERSHRTAGSRSLAIGPEVGSLRTA